ncbi:hypothetical protein FHY55_08740 [Oceanicola sp. D3]|uniref:DUF3592 domain-containing protein n=1 Tax=Oceanicola sp. D3 TaxID=2587163 RepID=UPI0011236C3D|nr:DUF3592 domain-containing protein [Oceanicola sp. D3]QDC09324.1 hypothetical protein FHY55_08740 [Oceanicola sp. D3]
MLKWLIRGGGWLVLLCFALGAIGLWVWISEGARGREFARSGIETSARVVERDRRVRIGGSKTPTTDYRVTVTYTSGTAPDLQFHRATETVSSEFYFSVSEGDTITVKTLPDRPDEVEIEPGGVSDNAFWAGIAGAVFTAAGLLAALLFAKTGSAARALRRHGTRTNARILALRPVGNRTALTVAFTDATGQERQAEIPPSPTKLVMGAKPGDNIAITYAPERPGHALLTATID